MSLEESDDLVVLEKTICDDLMFIPDDAFLYNPDPSSLHSQTFFYIKIIIKFNPTRRNKRKFHNSTSPCSPCSPYSPRSPVLDAKSSYVSPLFFSLDSSPVPFLSKSLSSFDFSVESDLALHDNRKLSSSFESSGHCFAWSTTAPPHLEQASQFDPLNDNRRSLKNIDKHNIPTTTIRVSDWFSEIVGVSEPEFRQIPLNHVVIPMKKGRLGIRNVKSGAITCAGKLTFPLFKDLITEIKYPLKPKPHPPLQEAAPPLPYDLSASPYITIRIISRSGSDLFQMRHVDIGYLQALPENCNAVFQVASNFNVIEGDSEYCNPSKPSFTQNYYKDKTQGPSASISCGGGAITRVHAPFYAKQTPHETWSQTKKKQCNLMNNLGNYFSVRNGYLHVKETDLPERNTHKYQKLLMNTYVCYHKDIQVTSGFRTSEGLLKVNDPQQKVDQVFVAAINIQQGEVGISNASQPNIQQKCKFILDYAYQSTYVGAIYHQRTHIFLTLVGGGAFGNNKTWIYEAIVNAHKKWGQKNKSTIQQVSLVLYDPKDFEEQLIELFKHHDIDYTTQII